MKFKSNTAGTSIDNLYYQSDEMLTNYSKYQDVVFINRRIYKTRFNRKFLIFQGIDHEAKTCVYGVSIAKEEQVADYKYAIECFI